MNGLNKWANLFIALILALASLALPGGQPIGRADEPPEPLPRDCDDVTPPGGPPPACCVHGYVYHGGAPVAGASVRIESPHGALDTTTDGAEPHYGIDLSSAPLSASVGDVITLTASYNGLATTRTWVVQSEGQQVDLGLDPAVTAGRPTARVFHGWVYDSTRGRFVLFGGWDGAQYLNDTWEFDGMRWHQINTPQAPSARGRFDLAYDSARQRVVLFGGTPAVGVAYGDTWEYDGVNWTQVTTADAPSPRADMGMTFDIARGRVVLFGGTDDPGVSSHVFDDTWEYDGVNWVLKSPVHAPSPRCCGASFLAYDSQRQRTILHGGWVGGCNGDTWEYDGLDWTQRASGGPSRYAHSLVYDSDGGQVILQGGGNCSTGTNDTWEYDPVTTTWTEIPVPANPPGFQYAPLAYEPVSHQAIRFGGGGWDIISDELWAYDPVAQEWHEIIPAEGGWVQVYPATTPPARSHYAMAYDSTRQRTILFGGAGESQCYGDTWEYDGTTWVQTATNGPSARTTSHMVYDPTHDKVILFGGYVGCNSHNINAETWLYDPATHAWTQAYPASAPSGRGAHHMVYDQSRQRVVLFGGWNDYYYLNDTWEYDGSNWTQVTTAHTPVGRAHGHLAYDAGSSRVVLLSGFCDGYCAGGPMPDDMWAYDGTDWTLMASPSGVAPRTQGAMAYDTARDRLVLFGGFTGSSALGETWEFDGSTWALQSPAVSPSPRHSMEMVYDAARGRMVLFGGYDGTNYLSDTWEYVTGGYGPPAANFTAAPTSGPAPLNVQFTDLSSGDVTAWNWDFGDGSVSGARHPAHTYANPGSYTVSLAVTGPSGSDTETKVNYIQVTGSIQPTWTFILYLAGDNNLEYWLTNGLHKAESAADNPYVQIVALLDGDGGGDTCRYKVRSDGNYTPGVDYWALGELDMGDPQTLSDFITWARDHYPADHYYLAVSNHGRGTTGIAWDDTSVGDFITVAELRTALEAATNFGAEPLDVVHYDACLMAMLENAYQIKDYADYLIASENLGWSIFAYDRYVDRVAAGTTPEQLAAGVVEEYYDALPGYPRTISALDLGQAGATASSVTALASALRANLEANKFYVNNSRNAGQKFDSRDYFVINNNDEYLDLYDLARLLKQNVPDAGVQAAAQGVMDAVTAFVVAEQHASGYYQSYPYWDLDDAHGAAIYFPPASEGWGYDDYMAHVFRFTAEGQWDDFLLDYFGVMGLPPETPVDPGVPPILEAPTIIYLPLIVREH